MSAAIIAKVRQYGASDGFDNVITYPDATISLYIADAQLVVPASKLGNKATLATAYYTLHLMYQSSGNASSSGGSKTKEKVGDVEVTFSAGSSASSGGGANDKYLDLYNNLIKNICRGGPMVLNGR